MARNQVEKLWTTIVTAMLTLCAALGLMTTTASAAVPHTGSAGNSRTETPVGGPRVPIPAQASRPRPHTRSLPPTMKQRIRAEAHGSSPNCRHRRSAEARAAALTQRAHRTGTDRPPREATTTLRH
ncbi:DUF6344 domain-containing protein [Streptomyces sp. MS06]|uniref:DUF6344 domain-containing protein n=1 Tax=Streptomyces sp. MS06 TaxID=3385974 RepID=UPI00399FBA7F